MGQYQHWLHFREVDQLLQAQLTTLEQELAQVEEQLDALQLDPSSIHENPIIQALLQQPVTDHVPQAFTPEPSTAQIEVESEPPATISSALFAWGHLPRFDSQELAGNGHAPTPPEPAQSPVNPDTTLLPTNINAFVHAHSAPTPQSDAPVPDTQSAPPLEADPVNTRAVPVDQQSRHTDQRVERWFKRWQAQMERQPEISEGLK